MTHAYQDRVSMEMARRVAGGLPAHPEWITLARSNIERWRSLNGDTPGLMRCYDEWDALLKLPIEQVCGILIDDSDEGQRLRQNSPFVGVLSPQDVWEIKRRVRHEEIAT